MGLNEAAGYGALALTALLIGYITAQNGLRPDLFFLGMAFVGLGLGLSTLFVRETHGHARQQARIHVDASAQAHTELSTREVFVLTGKIAVLAALYPEVWGIGQLLTGALS